MSEIQPALSKSEWEGIREYLADDTVYPSHSERLRIMMLDVNAAYHIADELVIENPHAVAAICLIDKACGFTHEDIGVLENISSELLWVREDERFASIVARLRALLPPQDSSAPSSSQGS